MHSGRIGRGVIYHARCLDYYVDGFDKSNPYCLFSFTSKNSWIKNSRWTGMSILPNMVNVFKIVSTG